MADINKNWSVIYERAVKSDGSLYFHERLSKEFLDEARKKMGSVLFSNQYLNEVFPSDAAVFKKEWFRYYHHIPHLSKCYNFAFIDPAISVEDGADYTGITIVSVDSNTNWYFRLARRERLNPTQIVEKCFDLHREFNLHGIGIETVAYQKALIYMLADKMREKQMFLPIKEVQVGTDKTKEMRIMSLVPIFEWGRAYLAQDMHDFEKELLQFPRSQFDDISDSAAGLFNVVFYPVSEEKKNEPTSPHDPTYESSVIRNLVQRANDAYESGSESY